MMKIIDAHSHLWLRQDTTVNNQPIKTTTNGRSLFFGEEVQMLPPFMIDGRNSAEVFLSNMDYAQVSAAVVVQEFIDGLQNDYLVDVMRRFPQRFVTCGMAEFRHSGYYAEVIDLHEQGFNAIAIPGHRLPKGAKGETALSTVEMMNTMKYMEKNDMVLSICLDDDIQCRELQAIIEECPDLRIAIGHFGMPTTPYWEDQIKLARAKNVMVESGGITWLYNSEFYPFPSAVDSIRKAADMVGMEKLMWGSDYPRTITAITYKMSYDFVIKSDKLTQAEKEAFLGGNAARFYRLKDLVELPYIKNMSE